MIYPFKDPKYDISLNPSDENVWHLIFPFNDPKYDISLNPSDENVWHLIFHRKEEKCSNYTRIQSSSTFSMVGTNSFKQISVITRFAIF